MNKLDKYIDLTDTNIDFGKYKFTLNEYEYQLINEKDEIKDGFILAVSSKRNSYTICDLRIRYSSSRKKFVTTLVFKRTDKDLETSKVKKGVEFRRIPFDSSDNGYTEFWKMIAFLTQFKDVIDLTAFKKELRVVDDPKIQDILDQLELNQLEDVTAAAKHKLYRSEIGNLLELVRHEMKDDVIQASKTLESLKKYSAGKPETIFQRWIEDNLWVFGVEYSKKHDSSRISFFSDSDLLMESLDGYLDLIELKRPLTKPLFNYDKSHKSYYPSAQLSEVIGQSLYYLMQMDEFKLNIEKLYKAKIIKPRVKIVIGRSNKFGTNELNALRALNMNLQSIQIITYDYLFSSANKILKTYEK